ncbi:MAG: hypothetical protein NTZ34_06745 [Chloroflexi bacterium]|nr:hypothetical protein [Chloroflexota bacterium]
MDKTPDVLYSEREKRINDAIQLKVPDRVPFFPLTPVIAAKYAGISMKEAFYDPAIWYNANKQMNIELQPDIIFPAQSFFSGQVYDAVDCKQLMWPGHGIPDDTHHQYVEQEYMKQDEYATLLEDPSDFTLRTYLPRVFGTLTAFNMLPPLQLFLFGYVSVSLMPLFNLPGFASAIESLRKASVEAAKWANANTSYLEEMKNLGFPCSHIAQTLAPFDLISDVLRGMRGSLTDMFRQPDKLLAAVEKLYPTVLWLALFVAKMRGNPRVYIPLHRGADGFMSEEQFETFYWPTLKRLILDIIKDGLTPVVFWEGTYDSRLK